MEIGNRRFILDTDIGPDCDDAAALALAAIAAEKTGRELLAVMHCTSSPWGAGAIRHILNWYGRSNIAVGTLKDAGFLTGSEWERYNRALAKRAGADACAAEDCLPLYRRLLARQPDGSVEIVGIGPMRNLANLLASGADEISPLTGRQLIAQKVARLTVMAGNFAPDSDAPEWNVEMDVASARRVAGEWPGEIVYCGWEVGAPVVTLREPCGLDEENPVRTAYRLHSGGAGRSSWDLCTVQWAMEDACGNYALSAPGVIDIDARGVTRWRAKDGGRHFYLKLAKTPAQTAADLERTLVEYDRNQSEGSRL